jgi:hypothetical protein
MAHSSNGTEGDMKHSFPTRIDVDSFLLKSPDEDGARTTISNLYGRWWQSMVDLVRSIPLGKEVELTEEQKFAVALVSGVPIESTVGRSK